MSSDEESAANATTQGTLKAKSTVTFTMASMFTEPFEFTPHEPADGPCRESLQSCRSNAVDGYVPYKFTSQGTDGLLHFFRDRADQLGRIGAKTYYDSLPNLLRDWLTSPTGRDNKAPFATIASLLKETATEITQSAKSQNSPETILSEILKSCVSLRQRLLDHRDERGTRHPAFPTMALMLEEAVIESLGGERTEEFIKDALELLNAAFKDGDKQREWENYTRAFTAIVFMVGTGVTMRANMRNR